MEIKQLRGKLKMSQQGLADETGISKAKIEKWELNKASPKVDDYITLQNFFRERGVLNSEDTAIKINGDLLQKESQLASIMANIKLEYLTTIIAEIQEKIDSTKKAEIIVSRLEMLSQSDFENKLNKMKV